MELDPQPTNDPQQFGAQTTVISNYASLNEATRSPEATEATATDLLGAPGKTIVPVKMLIGKWNFSSELRGLAG